jgi:broad specificity phosphatase PhoE
MTHPVRLLLVRHGEVEDRYHRVFAGRQIDMELSPRGHEQAAVLSRYVRQRPLDRVYASPMRRAQQTLAPLLDHCPKAPVLKPEFSEVDFGDWTGLTWEQVHGRFGVRAFDWLRQLDAAGLPNGESGRSFVARVGPPLRRIVRDHAGETVAIVCHGGVVRAMLSILLGLSLPQMASFEIDYASLTRVEVHENKTEVTLLNFTPWRDLA